MSVKLWQFPDENERDIVVSAPDQSEERRQDESQDNVRYPGYK